MLGTKMGVGVCWGQRWGRDVLGTKMGVGVCWR